MLALAAMAVAEPGTVFLSLGEVQIQGIFGV